MMKHFAETNVFSLAQNICKRKAIDFEICQPNPATVFVPLISSFLVPVIFLKPPLGILCGNSLGAPQNAVKRTFLVLEEFLTMSFSIFEDAWRNPVQEPAVFLWMVRGGNCAIWEIKI